MGVGREQLSKVQSQHSGKKVVVNYHSKSHARERDESVARLQVRVHVRACESTYLYVPVCVCGPMCAYASKLVRKHSGFRIGQGVG